MSALAPAKTMTSPGVGESLTGRAVVCSKNLDGCSSLNI